MDHADYLELDLALAKLEVGVCTETIIASGVFSSHLKIPILPLMVTGLGFFGMLELKRS
ncbi:hypothetical protein M3152_07680 [Sporosarcina luteola]|uniref:hypothetical protein n=1 Tax=Bacillales TaxID=1385 RepID=UPI00203D8186|nr:MULTISPECIES: hypothetical protein [Bacillales]MCM3637599.1 hypothetical protein [Sporosarcina luteola]